MTSTSYDRGTENPMNASEVIVVGAGPTGLMLACELALAGVDVCVLERRATQANITRAFAVHARTLEILDARGLADDLVARGVPVREIQPVPGATVDLARLPTRFPMILIAPQSGTETVLGARARELGVRIVTGAEVRGLRQEPDRVVVELADGTRRSAKYLVGTDGAHSTVRSLIGVDFPGSEYDTHILLADVRLTDPPEDAMFARTNAAGAVIVVPFGDGWFRAIAWDRLREQVPLDVPLPMDEMQASFRRIAGTDLGMSEQRWSTRFLSERRQASRYRVDRVFLAGDAAHVHSPLGGQGMNTGIQDAANLGWKLAAAVQGRAPAWLLDSYAEERHRVGAQVLLLTDGFNRLVLGRSAVRRAVQQRIVRLLIRAAPLRRRIVGRLTGLGIAYPPRTRHSHPWTGRRAPDLTCGTGRLYEVLRDGRFVLVDGTASGACAKAAERQSPQLHVVRRVHEAGSRQPAVMLIRPDGYIAWCASDRPDAPGEAGQAIAAWCGIGTVAAGGVRSGR
jgi:2-polyprenyl-6-methoxyphenol hydroxylase-like FAD-dependent oxidoreductase